jgi:hypothetical protein
MDRTRNPIHAVSYASVVAGRWKGNDDEEKSPLTTLLPATPERPKERRLAKQARKPKLGQGQKSSKQMEQKSPGGSG